MTWILPEGSRLSFEGLSTPLQVLRGIGSGSQGQVYEVELAGERLALKWYLPACISRDQGLERRLLSAISSTAPSSSFLWPIALLRPSPESQRQFRCQEPGFGYLMNLRPPGFVGAVEHYGGLVEISLPACCALAWSSPMTSMPCTVGASVTKTFPWGISSSSRVAAAS
jgi:eukaryotic-like serine/threonine-protein kinase